MKVKETNLPEKPDCRLKKWGTFVAYIFATLCDSIAKHL